jgi:hypothetical protein
MLKEGETVEIGNWGSNKQFARYPLTVEVNVAMLKVVTNERSVEREGMKGKNEMERRGMLSAGTNFYPEMLTQPQ